jgi:hypothetical protein
LMRNFSCFKRPTLTSLMDFNCFQLTNLASAKKSHWRCNDFIGLDGGSRPQCTACPGLDDSESAWLPCTEYPSTGDGSRLPRPA